ncbi:G protein-activated inward rectifier potassium channel 3-like [Acanthaster planci]|uniref:G protein-activated inward rectifier potassium channel 3 n=1 Tax=Acanthaster planci TaxID=133434 RepID=A0A8B7YM47_ACAPL|nr:G protein-activated inward rectifier potassium channel 3-like [Acanthaster planci]
MMSLPKSKKCHECAVTQFSQPVRQGPVRPCLSCSVSVDMEEGHQANPSLPWSRSVRGVTENEGKPECLMRQKSIQKIIHQVDTCKRRKLKRLVDKQGACNVVHNTKVSYAVNFINDIFTTIIDLRWRFLLLFFSLAYVVGWVGFSGLWYCLAWRHGDLGYRSRGDENFMPCVAHVDTYIGALLFSIETQTTIGYGFRSVTEECWMGPSLVVIQSVFSALIDAILVGCIFVKIARPKKRAATIKFSHEAVIAMRDGKLCFMFRIGDIRNSHLFGATIRAKLVRPRITREEECIPLHSYPMDVGESAGEDNLLLVWPLIICHVIDENSPLYKYSYFDLLDNSFEIVVCLEGIVEQTGLLTQVRTSYLPLEIKWGHRFSSHVVSMADTDDKLSVDYSHFNITYAVSDTPKCSAYELDYMKKTGKSLRPMMGNGNAWARRARQNKSGKSSGPKECRLYPELFSNDEDCEEYEKEEDDTPLHNREVTRYTYVNEIDESPVTTPVITGMNDWNFMESNI